MMLERAHQARYPRPPHLTPYEYAVRLAPHLTGEQEPLDGLTQAFVEARYSHRNFQSEEVSPLRRLLKRLRTRLGEQKVGPDTGTGAAVLGGHAYTTSRP